jgi:hypothetical protein
MVKQSVRSFGVCHKNVLRSVFFQDNLVIQKYGEEVRHPQFRTWQHDSLRCRLLGMGEVSAPNQYVLRVDPYHLIANGLSNLRMAT